MSFKCAAEEKQWHSSHPLDASGHLLSKGNLLLGWRSAAGLRSSLAWRAA